MPEFTSSCPLPLPYEHIVLAHGGGGRLSQQLLTQLILPIFNNPLLQQQHDSTVLPINGAQLAFTTDSYVIHPLFFPGGDIGKLAVCGTLNDLAMSGAKPLYLSCALIMEEGLPLTDLERILHSMQQTAAAAGVMIVTGDSKTVDHGKGDGLYLNTAGIGIIANGLQIGPQNIQEGDSIIVSSDLGRHGIAIMLAREGMNFSHQISSDCADLSGMIQQLLQAGIQPHCLRDLTRGGLATALIELASSSQLHFNIQARAIPVHAEVQSACDILGFDPLYIANEGCCVLFVPANNTEATLAQLRQHPLGQQACVIGQVKEHITPGRVSLTTELGTRRLLDLLSGEQLPRIC